MYVFLFLLIVSELVDLKEGVEISYKVFLLLCMLFVGWLLDVLIFELICVDGLFVCKCLFLNDFEFLVVLIDGNDLLEDL